MDYIIEIANDHPYLWALYAIALVSPFVLCAACCVRAKVHVHVYAYDHDYRI